MAAEPLPLTVRVQADAFDPAAETASLSSFADAGAVVSFLGVCRSESDRLAGLELEHYPGMVENEIARIAREAASRWPLIAVTVVHRHGRVAVGEPIVLVGTVSSHRTAAFEAAQFLMDWLKTRAPFWKREILSDGSVGPWVEAREADDDAAARWTLADAD